MDNYNTSSPLNYEIKIEELPKLSSLIKESSIWFHSIELDYRKKKQMLVVRFVGARNMLLNQTYLDVIEDQLNQLQQTIISPLIKKLSSNFVIKLSVDSKGRFSFFDTALELKVDCGAGLNMHDAFREPFAVLMPFALYSTHIEFKGQRHRATDVQSYIRITPDELAEVLDSPIIAPRTRTQWYHIADQVYEEAQQEYRYKIDVPCIDGELYWDNKIDTIQFTLYEKDQKVRA